MKNKNLSLIRKKDIISEVKKRFLNYAIYTLEDRAIPNLYDGLKPVHRRILFAMYELKLFNNFKKSAKTVGDVIGKYHPHGDQAVYKSMVKMGQIFYSRYPLIDTQGNFGSIDGDEPAAMRYTEAKLSKISVELMKYLDKETVSYESNYDNSEKEPSVLPSLFPNLLVNGSIGIAVGFSTRIPSHNLNEIISSLIALTENEDLTIDELLKKYIKGPDFPTGGYIFLNDDLKKAYLTGHGSVTIRGKAVFEKLDSKRKAIVITEIPYQLKKSDLVLEIAYLIEQKKIQDVYELRDESNYKGIRIVLELKRENSEKNILYKLFKWTQLQTKIPIIFLVLKDNKPQLMNLKSILTDYIDFQIDIIYKRSLFDLKAKEKEKHILDGFIVVINDIDRVVDLFKKAKDTKEALDKLKSIYDFSEEQLKAISGMRLQSLVILEKTKLETRLNILKQEIFELNEVISKKEKRVEILVKQLKAIKETYGDQRRTLILNEEEKISESDLFKKEDIVITLSNRDYIKRMPLISYRLQNRGGIGSKALNFSEGDNLKKILVTSTHCDLLFFTNLGRVYRLKAYQVPDYSKQAKGLPILNLIGISPLEKVNIILTIDDYQKEKYLLFFTKLGFVKKTLLKDFISVQKKGKIAIKLRDNDEVINCFVVGSNTNVVIASNTANLVHFNTKQLRSLSRSSIGVKGINLKKDSYVIASCYSDDLNSSLLTISEKGIGKLTLLKDYRLTKRGTKGVKAFKVSNKTGLMAAVKIIDSLDDEILIYTNDGSTIRLDVKKIRHYKRYTQGVKLISLKKASQKIVAVEIVKTNKEIDDKN